jgi:hypothetical protein
VKASETLITGMLGGKVAFELARERMVTVKEGSARRAVSMGVPTEPDAPAMMTFLMGVGIFGNEVTRRRDYLLVEVFFEASIY